MADVLGFLDACGKEARGGRRSGRITRAGPWPRSMPPASATSGWRRGTVRKVTVRPALYGAPVRLLVRALRLVGVRPLELVRAPIFRLLAHRKSTRSSRRSASSIASTPCAFVCRGTWSSSMSRRSPDAEPVRRSSRSHEGAPASRSRRQDRQFHPPDLSAGEGTRLPRATCRIVPSATSGRADSVHAPGPDRLPVPGSRPGRHRAPSGGRVRRLPLDAAKGSPSESRPRSLDDSRS